MSFKMADYLTLISNAEALRVKQAMHKVAALSIFAMLSTAEITDVQAATATIDMAAHLQAAASSGYNWRLPEGTYASSVQINGKKDGLNALYGEGYNTVILATAPMTYQFYKDGTDNGGTKDPVILRDIRFNANRNAKYSIRIGASKKGSIVNVQCENFLRQGIRGGDDSGGATAMFYENELRHIHCDGGIANAGSIATMPTDGVYLTTNATDNFVSDVVAPYVSYATLQTYGGFNYLDHIHGYGDNSLDTGPRFNIVAGAATTINASESDNFTEAGIYVKFNSVSIVGGSCYFATGNTPSGATCFASIAAGSTVSVTGSITDNVLNVTNVGSGTLVTGAVLAGTGVAAGTEIITQLTGTAGGIGTYQVSGSQNVAAGTTITSAYGVLTTITPSPGTLAVGQRLVGANVVADTKILQQLTGSAGVAGTYLVSVSQTVASTNMTAAGPVAVLIDSSVGDCSVAFHELRGYNSINPAVLWLSANRPSGLDVIFTGDIYTQQINDVPAMHSIRGGFLFSRITGRDTRIILDASTGMKARTELRLVNALKYDYGFDASNNYTLSSWAGAVETMVMRHFYAAGQLEIYGKVLLGSSGGGLGFFGTTPISKHTTTPVAATDLATALTLLNDMRATMIAYGIIA